MQFTCIFGIICWCTLYFSVMSTTERDMNSMTQSTDNAFNTFKENGPETDTSDMLRGKKNKVTALPRNCLDLKKKGKKSGIYTINPCDDTPSKVVDVYCDMDTDGGGWTVIQRRDNYPEQQDFYDKTWLEYILGFGSVSRDFWLGNENIHCLTKQSYNEIRFDLEDWTASTSYAKYGFFYVHDETTKFKLVVKDYNGTAGDSLAHQNGHYFSTPDADNDSNGGNCATAYTGAWWYNSCHHSNLNGLYNVTTFGKGINWYHWKGHNYSLKKTEMKIRPKNY